MAHHVTSLLTAYVHDELPPHLRERVSRHVRECDGCYAALRRERELAAALKVEMHGMGVPRGEQLSRLLPAIVSETAGARGRGGRGTPGIGFGVVLVIALFLLMPALMMSRAVAFTVPQDQPSPQVVMTATQSVTDAPVFVVASPTAVAVRFEVVTEAPAVNPSPVPVLNPAAGG
ncbi:MAG: hypothetical protein Kow0077_05390 [Anaerolineae bacterium]